MSDEAPEIEKKSEQSAGEAKASDAGESGGAPNVDPNELANLRAAAAKLADIERKQAEAEQAAAIQRGEHSKVIEQTRAELEAVKAQAARQAEDLALVGIHAGLADEQARAVARALYDATPEGKRAPTLAEQVKAWAKKPADAPAGVRAYLTTPEVAPTGSNIRGVQGGTDEAAALKWARGRGLLPGNRTPNAAEVAAFISLHKKNKAG
jgi:DNA polymerase III gamma/tau subunit